MNEFKRRLDEKMYGETEYGGERELSRHDVNEIVAAMFAEFPVSEEWNQFMSDMFHEDGSYKADVWYDVLDSEQGGKILDWMIEVMKWKEKWSP